MDLSKLNIHYEGLTHHEISSLEEILKTLPIEEFKDKKERNVNTICVTCDTKFTALIYPKEGHNYYFIRFTPLKDTNWIIRCFSPICVELDNGEDFGVSIYYDKNKCFCSS